MEYKPRCSKTRHVHFQHCTPIIEKENECPDLASSRHAPGGEGGGEDSHAGGQEDVQRVGGGHHDHCVGGGTKNKDMRSLISVWEDMDTGRGGGYEEGLLSVPEGSGSSRRVSQEFVDLRGKFEKGGEG